MMIRFFLGIVFSGFVLLSILPAKSSYSAIVGDINQDGKIDLTEAIYALQVSSGAYPAISPSCQLTGKGLWTSGSAYIECDVITYNEKTYACSTSHTAGTFETESVNWVLLTQQGPAGVAPSQSCPGKSQMIGIDDTGNIICNPKKVFVSSIAYLGDLGGLTGADSKCNTLASNAGLSGKYKAWLSDSTGSPSTRFSKDASTYIIPSGLVVAESWDDLVDGSRLSAPIYMTELGVSAGSVNVWTSTLTDGTAHSTYDCDDWTSSDNIDMYDQGVIGSSTVTTTDWTETSIIRNCTYKHHIYCFEQ